MAEIETSPVHSDAIRAWFPALRSDTVFLENAGGSQVPGVVADAIRDYMTQRYVQLDAGYALSREATAVASDAHDFIRLYMNGDGIGEVALGPSTSVLSRLLADAYADLVRPGDEVVIAEAGHEANVGPWLRLERHGARIRTWKMERDSASSTLGALESVLSERTRLVAFPHVSNLMGEIVDVKAVTKIVHAVGGRVVVDGVAFAPHRAIDVRDWGVDWYVYSTYKVYGPHMAALFGTHDAYAELEGPNHFFIPNDAIPYKFELGGVLHEGCAGLLALRDYVTFLGGGEELTRDVIESAGRVMTEFELPLQARLIEYLRDRPEVRIVGPAHADSSRVGTISFVHEKLESRAISGAANEAGIGIRHGHMYAYRPCQALELDPDDGVVRVSLVHYNTLDEIDRLIAVFDSVL